MPLQSPDSSPDSSPKTIDQLAEDAGMGLTWMGWRYADGAALQHFAALVAERCAEIAAGVCAEAADLPESPSPSAYRDAILAEFPKP